MNNTDKRQMIDEIEMMGKQKEFRKLFIKALKGATTLKETDDILDEKRKTYNHSYINIFKKYNVPHDDLYTNLDKVWNLSLEGDKDGDIDRKIESLAQGVAGGNTTGGVVSAIAFSTIVASAGGLLTVSVFHAVNTWWKVRKCWNTYKSKTLLFAEEYLSSI